ncbi:porin [Pontiellaceae bacterium B1224]|nr:porin [Pontiellaceae bacterium B1224]
MKRSKIIRRLIGACLLLSVLAVYSEVEDTNVVAAAQADDAASWDSVFTPTNQIPFYINLYEQDGFYYEVMEDSTYDGKIVTSIFSDKRRLTGRLGAKLFLDGALYQQKGSLPDADSKFYIRKLRVNTYGRGYFLSPMTYGLEFGIADGSFFFNDGYLWFHEVPWVESVKMGVFTSPMSMSSLQSSSSTPMMEKAASVNAFAPGDKLGVQIGGATQNKRGTLYGGIFSDVIATENTASVNDAYRFVGRMTYLPLMASGTNATSRFIHLGTSFSYVHTPGDDVQYRARPESFQAPYLVDTGIMPVKNSTIAGVEAASQTGPLLLQSEFFYSHVGQLNGPSVEFWGGYFTGSLMLTGETRKYNRNGGYFSGITPNRKFSFADRSWGALEWATRVSYIDLTSKVIDGGTMGIISSGLNCYMTASNRIMFDVAAAHVRNPSGVPSGDGMLYYIQCRFQVEY